MNPVCQEIAKSVAECYVNIIFPNDGWGTVEELEEEGLSFAEAYFFLKYDGEKLLDDIYEQSIV